MDIEPQPQSVRVVTGAARSLGAAIALALGGPGTAVVVHYHGRAAEAQAVVKQLRSAGGPAYATQADLREPGAADRMLDEAIERWGRLDVVVANAGAPNPGVDVQTGTDDDLSQLLAVNATAVYAVLRAASSRLGAGGRLINIGSSSTLYPRPERALYSASKAASLVLTEAFATVLAGRGATANSVVVGPVDDGFLAHAPDAVKEQLAAAGPAGRLATADDVAGVVKFLAGEESRWIIGQQILVNGGALV
ncbi:MAG: SDR family oxidoreductase [Actinoplanes sp.]